MMSFAVTAYENLDQSWHAALRRYNRTFFIRESKRRTAGTSDFTRYEYKEQGIMFLDPYCLTLVV